MALGSIVSLGGGTGSGGGGNSGIQSLNQQTGPAIVITGSNGAIVTAGGNIINIDLASLSGLITQGSSSGIIEINGQFGQAIQISGINGIDVTQPRSNLILIDGASISGVGSVNKFATDFTGMVSGLFSHGLNTLDVIVQVRDHLSAGKVLIPDEIVIEDLDHVSIIFNIPTDGRVVILG